MSTGTLEIELLDVDFDAAIPCELRRPNGRPCGAPAAYRVTASCSEHGKRGTRLACSLCTGLLMTGHTACSYDDYDGRVCRVILEYTGGMKL